MPHQCLKCGNLFAEGSTTILRGCPDCRGTRFFFTEEPLSLSERERMLAKTEHDLPLLLEKAAEREAAPPQQPAPGGPKPLERPPQPEPLPVPPAFAPSRGTGEMLPDGRLLVKLPKNLHQRMRRATSGWDYEAPAIAAAPRPVPPPLDLGIARAADEPIITEIPKPAPGTLPAPLMELPFAPVPGVEVELESATRPETVRIEDLGKYEIDVRRLLERSPVVVHRDGSYVLHLPSLFEMPTKKK